MKKEENGCIIIVPFIFFMGVLFWGKGGAFPTTRTGENKKKAQSDMYRISARIGSERVYPRLKIEFTNKSHSKRRRNRTKQLQTHSNPRKATSPRTSPLAEARED
jgi:hypothetical protein